MRQYVLNYYKDFKCTASKCRHTCCAGWRITIDHETLGRYSSLESPYRDALMNGIDLKRSVFRTDRSGRCAFLTEEGLCDIITSLGEDSLCQVCRDHPRFRSYYDDRVEMGLGFTCEEAARLILTYPDPIIPILTTDDGEETEPDFVQRTVLDFRHKALELIRDRSIPIDVRIARLLTLSDADIPTHEHRHITRAFLRMERLDKSWSQRLRATRHTPLLTHTDGSLSVPCEQFLVNSIYRHLDGTLDPTTARAHTVATVISWWLVNTLSHHGTPDISTLIDTVRAYSSEIEYSDANLTRLYSLATRYVNV